MTKTTNIWAIILGLGLIGFVIYGINNYSKDATKSTFTKIVVDIIGVVLIIGAAWGIWKSTKSLAA